jgi:hypothetical protein
VRHERHAVGEDDDSVRGAIHFGGLQDRLGNVLVWLWEPVRRVVSSVMLS